MDFNWWHEIDIKKAYFVTRLKKNNANKELTKIQATNSKIRSQIISLTSKKTSTKGQTIITPLRRIEIELDDKRNPVLVTNDFKRSDEEISALYKKRWQIELFFKWVKQNLKIKKFLGRSENAVKTQICIALCTYIIMRDLEELRTYMSEICNYFSESKFLKMINNNIFKTIKPINRNRSRDNPFQLKLIFDKI